MGNVDRAERRRRRQRDDGDPEATVYFARARTSSNMGYHADPDCRHLQQADDVVEATRAQATATTRYPCSRCVLGDGETGGASDGPSLAQALRRDEITTVAEAKAYVEERGGV